MVVPNRMLLFRQNDVFSPLFYSVAFSFIAFRLSTCSVGLINRADLILLDINIILYVLIINWQKGRRQEIFQWRAHNYFRCFRRPWGLNFDFWSLQWSKMNFMGQWWAWPSPANIAASIPMIAIRSQYRK